MRIQQTQFYDAAFKRLMGVSERLVVEFINAVFQEQHPLDTRVQYYDKELIDSRNQKTEMDLLLGIGKARYQIECQTYEDQTMGIRMFEYGMEYALETKEYESYHMTLRMPRQTVVYLKNTSNTPDQLGVTVIFPDQQKVDYSIKTIKQLDYSPRELTESGMGILLPFQAMRLWKAGKRLEKEPGEKHPKFIENYKQMLKEILENMEHLYEENVIDRVQYAELGGILKEVHDYLYGRIGEIEERGADTMLKEKVRFWFDDVMEQGIEKGIEKGIEQGRIENGSKTVEKMKARGIFLEEACELANITQKEYESYRKQKEETKKMVKGKGITR